MNRLDYITGLVVYVIAKMLDVVLWFWTPRLRKPLFSHVCIKVLYPSHNSDLPLFVKKSTSDAWGNQEIMRLATSYPYMDDCEGVVQISDDTVVKLCDSFVLARSESLAIDLVRAKTCIPVPHVRKIIRRQPHRKGFDLIVMDLIPNSKQLHSCWPSLSVWEKLKVVLTLRHYFRQLRSIQASSTTPPGPLYRPPATCYGLHFGYNRWGPFPTMAALAQLTSAEDCSARGVQLAPGCQPLNESIFTPLIFTHNDLSMCNILIDGDGQLWIVDWNCAGFYPTWFEYLGMRFAARDDQAPSSWKMATNLIVEPSFEMTRWMSAIGRSRF